MKILDTFKTAEIIKIWDNYVIDKKVLDNKGREIVDINESRKISISDLKAIIDSFLNGSTSIFEFKTMVDSYNKRNNYWGFTATKGQMFFNQLVKNSEDKIDELTQLIKDTITQPENIEQAKIKIEALHDYSSGLFSKAKDKRKAPNPGSVNYFLSYFWQIQDWQSWPILYTSLINSFKELSIWEDRNDQTDLYEDFCILNDKIKDLLSEHSGERVSNWDAEHAFWNYNGNLNKASLKSPAPITVEIEKEMQPTIMASFELADYLIPKVSNLINLGNQVDVSSSAKGAEFEKLVSEIFKQLDFEVEFLGQGKGRSPDAIIKLREEHTAFIIDAKAYSAGYSMGLDDRAIREYINHYCPKLQKEGFKKIGFIIVSNSFKSDLSSFVNEITWNTEIKRFILLTSEALLYLLAYKTKDRLPVSSIIESLTGMSNPVISQDIIEEFDDI